MSLLQFTILLFLIRALVFLFRRIMKMPNKEIRMWVVDRDGIGIIEEHEEWDDDREIRENSALDYYEDKLGGA